MLDEATAQVGQGGTDVGLAPENQLREDPAAHTARVHALLRHQQAARRTLHA